MKNSILKSYTKKILRSEAFVSVIVVFVLALGIIGTSYALYMDVDTDTDYQLVEVGDLKISFDNIDNSTNPSDYNKISLTNLLPLEDEDGIKQTDNIFSFRIYNTGTYIADYDIKLVTSDGNQVDTKYINFQLCKDNATNCDEIKTLSNISDSIIKSDQISPSSSEDASVYYFLRIWINNQYPVTSTTNKINLRVMIEASNASGYLDNENALAGAILNNEKITINNTTPTFDASETRELGLFKAPDDYGTSYYFRGAQSNNYVNFAGLNWRVVRINGDGSIRLILDQIVGDKLSLNSSTYEITELKFNNNSDDNAYVGYMYGTPGSDNYDDTHKNINDSQIKTQVDAFYEKYLINYSDYLSDTIFCGDKSLSSKSKLAGYGNNETDYAGYERLYYSIWSQAYSPSPTLKCAEGETNTYSRYTVDSYTTQKGVETNGDLKYPIALPSADEVVMAGITFNTDNRNYYLYNKNISAYYEDDNSDTNLGWWTMTPSRYIYNGSDIFDWIWWGAFRASRVYYTSFRTLRPVINLKANTLITGGNGTSDSPYTIN